jgi:hypothetical protein
VSIVSLLALVIGFIALFWIIELQWLRKPRRYRALHRPRRARASSVARGSPTWGTAF